MNKIAKEFYSYFERLIQKPISCWLNQVEPQFDVTFNKMNDMKFCLI